MSIWVDIHKRSNRELDRKEEEIRILNEKEIREILESFKVGPTGYAPVRYFYVMTMPEPKTRCFKAYTIILTAIEHTITISVNSKVIRQTKIRDFNSDENVNRLMSKFNNIIKLC